MRIYLLHLYIHSPTTGVTFLRMGRPDVVDQTVVEYLSRPARYISAPDTPMGEIFRFDRLAVEEEQISQNMPGCSKGEGGISDVIVYKDIHGNLIDPASTLGERLNGRITRQFMFSPEEMAYQTTDITRPCTSGDCSVCYDCMDKDGKTGHLLWIGPPGEEESPENYGDWFKNIFHSTSDSDSEGTIDMTVAASSCKTRRQRGTAHRRKDFRVAHPWVKFVKSRDQLSTLIEHIDP